MNQYKVDYINYKNKNETAYLFAKDLKDAEQQSEHVLGVKKVIGITLISS